MKNWFDFLNNKNNEIDKFRNCQFFGQEGEDQILAELLPQNLGFYVDIGAFHPYRFSNTYYFYLKGWHGINIDPTPGMKQRFDTARPRDINLELGISSTTGQSEFFIFNEPALNTFDTQRARLMEFRGYELKTKKKISQRKLKNVLAEYLGDNIIDFITIDVETYEIQVLESNDWERYRPRFILVEILEKDLKTVLKHPIYLFLSQIGYSLKVKTLRTAIFETI